MKNFRDRYAGTVQDVIGGVAMIAALTVALVLLAGCQSGARNTTYTSTSFETVNHDIGGRRLGR